MQINLRTTWKTVKTQLTCSRLFKVFHLWSWTTRTCFAWSQKLPNHKTNSTEVFLAMKRTSVWKIIPNQLCHRFQDPKKQLGSFDKFTNGHFHFAELSPLLCLLSEPAIAWNGHPLTRLLIKNSLWIANRKVRGHCPWR